MASTHSSEIATECVESVKFSFLTTEEVRKHSFKKITEVLLFDNLDRPVPGGLYDPALGPVHKSQCQTCGLRSDVCPGHCGHIELVSPIYNPLLFSVLIALLRRMCFSCHSFTDEREYVERCAFQLHLILKGDMVRAKEVDMVLQDDWEKLNEEESSDDLKRAKRENLTSLQYSSAMALLDEFMKRKNNKCARCGFKGPKITQPTFGWIYMELANSTIRRNVIRGAKLDKPISEKTEGIDINLEGTPNNEKEANLPAEFFKQKKLLSGPLLPSEVKDHIQLLWENETQLCSLISDIHRERLCLSGKTRSYYMFFIDALLVPPIKFRPLTAGGDSVTNHPQTILLSKVLQSNIDLGNAINSDRSRAVSKWLDLQQSVNLLFGNKKSIGQRDNMASGICQVLEKKEGIFRQKMMGKRVNYSCRSVISPDPYIAVNEIGIPPCFALKLTYPERVTPWNVDKLRSAIINGPDELPGATHYSVHSVNNKLPPRSKKMRISIARKLPSSRGIITQLGKSLEHEQEGKVVYRHLRDGDIVLVNRQPTLHKPSIMAHVVRVLSGEKTIRMHYANCSTYNADFDGDEMNVHFPQDEISRAEGYQIVNANNQYIVPTSGDTKRGLIQDHIVSAVLLTKKDTFLSREEYTHLLYSSGVSAVARGSSVGKSCQKVFTSLSEDDIELTMPAIWKPEPLWTGKQVITSLLNHMTRSKGLPPFTFEGKCTLDNEFLTSQSTYNDPPRGKKSEHPAFQIHENEFLNGVIDKAQFGKYGLVHTVQELYGSNTAGMLLSGLSRLFTVFLQLHGFTCGIDDLLLKDVIDTKRREGLKKADKINEEVYLRFTNAEQENAGKDGEKISSQSVSLDRKDDNRDRMKLQKAIELKVRVHGDNAIKALDKTMTNAANELSNEISNIIFPRKTNDKSAKKSEDKPEDIGLSKSFPGNCFFLMTKSGAKGTQANFTQVSSLLGQQSLEGKRVPLMISGKTLPCFPPWDPALRAGGFITDCFLTGLRPQEYYFHCMAGREGLVDTAVKTSRSGYLQRCLVKNLECLKVTYDGTVRDADGSIIQFCYGEDGVDVHKTSFMSKFDTIACNHTVVQERLRGLQCKDAECLLGRTDNGGLRKKLKEKVNNVINTCIKKQHASDEVILEKNKKHLNFMQTKNVMDLMMLKYLSSLAEPGEPVGVIAAQSVGEPSTQMTLNTFHHAGQKVSNVTLGIPRLQEILMRASEKIQTPIMSCPLMKGKTKDDAEHLAGALRNVSLADIVESMEVSLVHRVEKDEFAKIYKLKMKLYDQKKIPESSGVQLVDCGEILTFKFVQELERAIKSHLAMLSKIAGIKNVVQETESDSSEGADEVDPGRSSEQKSEEHDVSDDDDDVAEDLDTDEQKRRRTDEMDYEDDMETENMDREPSEIHSENDQIELQAGNNTDDEAHASVADFESKVTPVSKPKLSSKKLKSEAVTKMASMLRNQKDDDRAVYVNFEGTHFEVHFRLKNNDPHILLSQIAQKAAKNVYVKKLAKVENCEVSKDTKNDEPPIIHILGSDFHALWDMQDEIDVKRIDSNDIHAILETYGVEAARATIVKELQNVFGTYGISTDFRHLSLIADFMTHSGQYRAMSRHTMADCISPFSKMSFETASTFIVDAAYHGDVDNLETPSARICLGMPVKMGTGSFDLMQKVQI